MAQDELLTAKKLAEKLGLSPSKVTKHIKDNDIQPDKTKGACKYYGPGTAKALEEALKESK